jgi:perosamine synthetase
MSTARYPLAQPYFPEAMREAICAQINEILSGGRLMLGPYSRKLEETMADFVGVPHAVSLNSCTTALTIALQYYGVVGSEVLVPAGSFVTDVSSVLFAGGTPVLVDINPETLSFDLDDLRSKICDRTKAIIWVHLTGTISPEYREILAIARENGVPLIEDAAQAHGSRARGQVAGSLGDVGCFSFYPTKVMTCGSGGMLTTRDEKLKRYAQEMRLFGKDLATEDVNKLGNDWFLDEIRACVAYNQLLDLSEMVTKRRELAKRYAGNLCNQPGITLILECDGFEPSYYQYPILIDERLDFDAMRSSMRGRFGIQTRTI